MHFSWVEVSPSKSANSLLNLTPFEPLDLGISRKSVPSSREPTPTPLKPTTIPAPTPTPMEPGLAPTSLYDPQIFMSICRDHSH